MKWMIGLSAVLLLSLTLVTSAQADTITPASIGTAANAGQSSSSGSTFAIAPKPNWAAALPEPASLALFGSGLALAGGFLRRRILSKGA